MTVLDLNVVLAQVRTVIDRASLAVQYVFLFTLLAGIVVMLAAIQLTRDERRFESAILHTLGAARRKILQGLAVEFLTLGGLAGILAALGATAVGWALARFVFEMDYSLNPLLWLAGLVAGAAIVGFTGTFATRRAVNEPPVAVLRERWPPIMALPRRRHAGQMKATDRISPSWRVAATRAASEGAGGDEHGARAQRQPFPAALDPQRADREYDHDGRDRHQRRATGDHRIRRPAELVDGNVGGVAQGIRQAGEYSSIEKILGMS